LILLLLDTDIVVDLLRQFPPATAWLTTQISEEIYIPGFVVMELIQGCADKRELAALQKFITPFPMLWPSPQVADDALAVYAGGRLSHNIGILDALIGQLAVSLGTPLHTFNEKHFTAVPHLRTVQPYPRGQ
jgi:predicted nucleic acid-binding protein